jgi:hypothetical protein
MSDEQAYLFAWVCNTLLNDAGKPSNLEQKIYPADQVPQGVRTPYLKVIDRGNADIMTMNGVRIFSDLDFAVELWDKSQYGTSMVTTMNWVDGVLHKAVGDFLGATILSCIRKGQWRRRDDEDTQLVAMGYTFNAKVQRLGS